MNILIRVDASVAIGTGHVMRALTLAEWLRNARCDVRFVMKEGKGDLCSYVENRGFQVFRIASVGTQEDDAKATIQAIRSWNKGIDWCVVDHYELDVSWEKQIKTYVKKIMVIDDLANRPHECDVLLDQNYYVHYVTRYDRLVPNHCKLLLGPKYVLLREEFYNARARISARTGHVRRVLVFFGGSDPTNETERVLHALRFFHPLHIDVVVGTSNLRRHTIERMCEEVGANYHCQIDYIAELMAKADVAIGAGGVAMWERCFLGLPSLVTVVADNQKASAEAVAAYGAIRLIGWHEHVTIEKYMEDIRWAIASPTALVHMSERALQLMGTKNEQLHPLLRVILEG